jgi:Na+/serine symporter
MNPSPVAPKSHQRLIAEMLCILMPMHETLQSLSIDDAADNTVESLFRALFGQLHAHVIAIIQDTNSIGLAHDVDMGRAIEEAYSTHKAVLQSRLARFAIDEAFFSITDGIDRY